VESGIIFPMISWQFQGKNKPQIGQADPKIADFLQKRQVSHPVIHGKTPGCAG